MSARKMLVGHNTNMDFGGVTYHVQTEDRGVAHALLDTTVFHSGRVLHRRTNNYFDLLPLTPDREAALKLRLDEQHRAVLEDIRNGAINLTPPPPHVPAPPTPVSPPHSNVVASTTPAAASSAAPDQARLRLMLINAKNWLKGGHATLHVAVGHPLKGVAVAFAQVTARIEGAAEPFEFSAKTGLNGEAQLEFDMPRVTGDEPALIIEAATPDGRGLLRFQLRSKPRVPAGSS